jgi:hypothetical protein
MEPTTISASVEWLDVIRHAVTTTDGSKQAVLDAIRNDLKTRPSQVPFAAAFSEALGEFVEYATAPIRADADAVDLEVEAVAASRRILRPLLETKVQARLDALDEQHRGESQCTSCQASAESQGRVARSWVSLFGSLKLWRRYRYCETCDQGSAPAQQALGLASGEFTPRLEEACTMMTTTVSHGMAQELLNKLLGVEVSVKALEDMTERRGAAVQAIESHEATHYAPFDEKGLAVPTQERPVDAVAETAAPELAYLEVDGVSALTRQELTGEELTPADKRRQRQAEEEKARGGKGRRYHTAGKEVKNAVFYDGKACAEESPSRGCILEKTYVSHLGNWMGFVALLWVAMLRKRYDQAKLLVILSDGAEWIRSLAAWLPIASFLILDLYHVKRRIWEVANSFYGEHTAEGCQWAEIQCARVEEGRAHEVITALGFLHSRDDTTKKLIEDLAGWLTNNRDRMDYPKYRARGLRISSSAIESANFHVTGQRLKVQGTRWSEEGAGRMATLRADLFNRHWEKRTKEVLAAAA